MCQRQFRGFRPVNSNISSVKHESLTSESVCRVLSLTDCKYSLNLLIQTRIKYVRPDRIRRTFKLSYRPTWRVRVVIIGVLLRIKYLLTNN